MKSPAFQLYAADIYMDTNEWSAEAVGIYTRLLFHQWVNGSIPKDIKKLSQIALVSIKILSKRWPEMERKFVFDESLRGRNLRLEETRQKQIQYSDMQREKGRKRSEKMWENHIAAAIPTAINRLQPEALPKDSPSSSTSSSVNKKKEKGVFVLPDYIPKETWDSYMQVRIKKRAAQTPYALRLVIRELERLRDTFGNDPVAVLNKSITGGWSDVYQLKDGGGNGKGIRTSRSDPRDTHLQSREDAEVAALNAKYYARQAARDKAGRDAGNDDAPDFTSK